MDQIDELAPVESSRDPRLDTYRERGALRIAQALLTGRRVLLHTSHNTTTVYQLIDGRLGRQGRHKSGKALKQHMEHWARFPATFTPEPMPDSGSWTQESLTGWAFRFFWSSGGSQGLLTQLGCPGHRALRLAYQPSYDEWEERCLCGVTRRVTVDERHTVGPWKTYLGPLMRVLSADREGPSEDAVEVVQ